MDVAMCDHRTRTWCCRIGLVFTVLGVLCTMIYQIWSYYFFLVQQMDDMTIESPQLHAIVKHCQNKTYTWQAACSRGDTNMTCQLPDMDGAETYVDIEPVSVGVVLDGLTLTLETVDTCSRVMVWKLPWTF